MSASAKSSASSAAERVRSFQNHLKVPLNTADTSREKMITPYKFEGWMGLDKESAQGKMVWQEYEPKNWTEDDVDIKITHCGVCGSDIHTLRSGWGPSMYPCCVGHEIVGIAVKVGSNVKHLTVGDRVGVGAQSGSCLKCEDCLCQKEQYCKGIIGTYGGKYPDGSKSYGGYGNYSRNPGHFVVKIPEGLSSAEAAPMLCGGVTVWNPLVKNGAGPGKKVGIIGIGGLGHFALLWAKALGCDEVVAISRTHSKNDDAKRLGADRFIATEEDEKWNRKNARSLDLIISTVSSSKMPFAQYLQLLRTNGEFIQVGAPEDKFPALAAFSLLQKGCKIGGSNIGSPTDILQMLEFAVKHNVHPSIQELPMKDANRVIVDMEEGHARYRYVLVNP